MSCSKTSGLRRERALPVATENFGDLKDIRQPTLVVNVIHDELIPISNSYALGEHLPNAVLLIYPDSRHGSLFQFHESFTLQAAAFLAELSARTICTFERELSARRRRTVPLSDEPVITPLNGNSS